MTGITVVFDFNRFFTVLNGSGRERVRVARQRNRDQEDLNPFERQSEESSQDGANGSRSESRQSQEKAWSPENRDSERGGSQEWYKWAWNQNSEPNNADSDNQRASPRTKPTFIPGQPWDSIFVGREDFVIDWRKGLQERGIFPAETQVEHNQVEQNFGTGRLAEQARREAAETAAILADLRAELDAIDAAARNSPEALLRHVYSRHPPRNRGAAASGAPPPAGCPPAVLRRCLLGAIRAYHEDKNREAEHGRRWHLLCREITKNLIEQLELCD